MKKLFILATLFFQLISITSASSKNDSLWQAASEAYRNKAYEQALANYDTLMNRGFLSAELLNNAGNAAFKSKHIGKAVWCYEKAYRLDPSNEEIRYNKELMRFKIADRIEELPCIAPLRWINKVAKLFSPITWYWLAFILGIAFAVSLWLRHRAILKTAWTNRIVFFMAVLSVFLAYRSHYIIYGKDQAVVQFPSVSILSAPDASGVELFQLHEGVVVEISKSQGAWQHIHLADGKEGWMSKDAAKGF